MSTVGATLLLTIFFLSSQLSLDNPSVLSSTPCTLLIFSSVTGIPAPLNLCAISLAYPALPATCSILSLLILDVSATAPSACIASSILIFSTILTHCCGVASVRLKPSSSILTASTPDNLINSALRLDFAVSALIFNCSFISSASFISDEYVLLSSLSLSCIPLVTYAAFSVLAAAYAPVILMAVFPLPVLSFILIDTPELFLLFISAIFKFINS